MSALFSRRIQRPYLATGAFVLLLQASPSLNTLRAAPPATRTQPTIDFNRQIRPILSDNCFACHGPDATQRKAKLRLDTKDGSRAELRDGGFAIVPGKSAESVLMHASPPRNRPSMPPPKTDKKLTPQQIELLRQWIDQGAPWVQHWAFVAPRRPASCGHGRRVAETPIDHFILARLETEGLRPSPEADKTTLIRRVTLDLTGLPPTPRRSMPSSPTIAGRLREGGRPPARVARYGEHMARYWLDAARYGDTHGLHLDNYREIWPYRDWVIKAFNSNLPFDRFIVEQLAGDLLPERDARPDRRHRLQPLPRHHQRGRLDRRGGLRPQRGRPGRYHRHRLPRPDDRLRRCHDHKYDPISRRTTISSSRSSTASTKRRWTATRPSTRRFAVECAEQAAGPGAASTEGRRHAGARFAAEVAKVKYDDGVEQEAAAGLAERSSSGSTTNPIGAQFASDGGVNGLELRPHRTTRSSAAAKSACAPPRGAASTPSKTPARAARRRGRRAVRLRLPRPGQSAQGDHAAVAHRRAGSTGPTGATT